MKRLIVSLILVITIFVKLTPVDAAEVPLINNVFTDTHILEVLRDISLQAGTQIVADESVTGYVNLQLSDVPLEKALELVLSPGGYAYKKINDYYLVGSCNPKNASFSSLTQVELIKFRYVKADVVKNLLPAPFLDYIKFDNQTNTALLSAPEPLHSQIKRHILEADRALPQVMIEAMVIELSRDARNELGLDWQVRNKSDEMSPGVQSINQILNVAIKSDKLALDFLSSIKALTTKGSARIEANPRVCTLDGYAAEMSVGRDSYYEIGTENATGGYGYRLESIKTGITLRFIPQVSDNEITMQIEPEVSDVISESTNLPVVSRRSINTTVRVKTGETIVLGGLLQKNQEKKVKKVPILGYLPLLGALFTSTQEITTENEVIIIVTPYLVDSNTDGITSRISAPSISLDK